MEMEFQVVLRQREFSRAGAPILINSPITKTVIRTRKTEFAVPLRTNQIKSNCWDAPSLVVIYILVFIPANSDPRLRFKNFRRSYASSHLRTEFSIKKSSG